MHHKNKIARIAIFALALIIIFAGCKKLSRPTLGDFPKDSNPPNGPLRFYVAFDGTTSNPLMNGVDSIKADFPSVNPFTIIDGIKGKGAKGVSQKALLYPAANDFDKSTSFTVAFWEKNSVPQGDPQFVFSLASKDYWHQSGLFMLVDHHDAGSTVDSTAVSFVIQDNWFVTHGPERLGGHMLDGNWHHVAITYDETTSKINYYVDGVRATNVSDSSSVWGWNGPLHGKVHFADDYGFVLGGWNKHANLGNGAPTDDWIQSWQGGLDQFRLYNYALSQSDIQALVNGKE